MGKVIKIGDGSIPKTAEEAKHIEEFLGEEIPVYFSGAGYTTERATTFLPDGTKLVLGEIEEDFSLGEGKSRFLSTDPQGKELFPPTDDILEAHGNFERYAEHLHEECLARMKKAKESEKEMEEAREQEIIFIRGSKFKNRSRGLGR